MSFLHGPIDYEKGDSQPMRCVWIFDRDKILWEKITDDTAAYSHRIVGSFLPNSNSRMYHIPIGEVPIGFDPMTGDIKTRNEHDQRICDYLLKNSRQG